MKEGRLLSADKIVEWKTIDNRLDGTIMKTIITKQARLVYLE